jgi:NADH dehydrogenase
MILVAGATGQLGGMIAGRLLDSGEDVAVLVRKGSDHAALEAKGANTRFGDLRDYESLVRACEGARVVVSTANSAARGGDDNVNTVEIEGNRHLIDAARAAGVEHFIFVSALGADLKSPIPFMRGKAIAELHLRESGMEHTILQPNLFLEVWAGMLVAGPLLAGQPVTLIGDGTQRRSMISVSDVASFAIASIHRSEARNRTIALGGPEALSWREVVARFEKVTGREVEIHTVPVGSPLPGLPDVATELSTAFTTFESPIPMEETARTLCVSLTPIETVIRQMMPPVEVTPLQA